MIGRRISAEAEARFFRSLADGDVLIDELNGDDLVRIADLVIPTSTSLSGEPTRA